MNRATILFAHGSRDPLWSRPMEAVAQRMRDLDPCVQVQCAYLELMQPDLASVVREFAATGCTAIQVVPMFLGVGRHAREDLPALVRALAGAHPGIDIALQPAVGEDARIVDLLARVALGGTAQPDDPESAPGQKA
jgi:sirohydrochlorin cobaltochelatase